MSTGGTHSPLVYLVPPLIIAYSGFATISMGIHMILLVPFSLTT